MSEFRIFCIGASTAFTIAALAISLGDNPYHLGIPERQAVLVSMMAWGGAFAVAFFGRRAA